MKTYIKITAAAVLMSALCGCMADTSPKTASDTVDVYLNSIKASDFDKAIELTDVSEPDTPFSRYSLLAADVIDKISAQISDKSPLLSENMVKTAAKGLASEFTDTVEYEISDCTQTPDGQKVEVTVSVPDLREIEDSDAKQLLDAVYESIGVDSTNELIEKLFAPSDGTNISTDSLKQAFAGMDVSDYARLIKNAKNISHTSGSVLKDLPTASTELSFYLHEDENGEWKIYDVE